MVLIVTCRCVRQEQHHSTPTHWPQAWCAGQSSSCQDSGWNLQHMKHFHSIPAAFYMFCRLAAWCWS